jgi:hypothetical protein
MSFIFASRINGIPCQIKVVDYSPGRPMIVYGSGYGDAHPPEPENFEYTILDRRGRRAEWLDRYVTSAVDARLLEEYKRQLNH